MQRLPDDRGGPVRETLAFVFTREVACNDDGDRWKLLPELRQEVQAIDIGQDEVEKNKVDRHVSQHDERGTGIFGRNGDVVDPAEEIGEEGADFWFVNNDQNLLGSRGFRSVRHLLVGAEVS